MTRPKENRRAETPPALGETCWKEVMYQALDTDTQSEPLIEQLRTRQEPDR